MKGKTDTSCQVDCELLHSPVVHNSILTSKTYSSMMMMKNLILVALVTSATAFAPTSRYVAFSRFVMILTVKKGFVIVIIHISIQPLTDWLDKIAELNTFFRVVVVVNV